jgi:hypothetical protein
MSASAALVSVGWDGCLLAVAGFVLVALGDVFSVFSDRVAECAYRPPLACAAFSIFLLMLGFFLGTN